MAEGRRKLEILVLNQVSARGLERLPAERYSVVTAAADPDAVLVRSKDLHATPLGERLRAVGRAGAGTNNIPVGALTARGIPVFNAPGANANAVKELVIAGLLMAARNIPAALDFVRSLDRSAPDLDRRVEDGKKAFAGLELPGQTLGVIGLGRVGSLVADAALRLGMDVIGYDPEITVEGAWSLPSQVRRARAVDELMRASRFVSVHVPLTERTRHVVGARNLGLVREGAIVLNFSREGVVEDSAVLAALATGKLRTYVTDFPTAALIGVPGVVALPHLGASTGEAEDNSAVMVVDQLRECLEHGNLRNAVNFPEAVMPRESAYRLAIANANVPDMLARISHAMGERGINIHNMLNKSRGEVAYTLVDVDSAVPESALAALRGIDGVLAVSYLPAER